MITQRAHVRDLIDCGADADIDAGRGKREREIAKVRTEIENPRAFWRMLFQRGERARDANSTALDIWRPVDVFELRRIARHRRQVNALELCNHRLGRLR